MKKTFMALLGLCLVAGALVVAPTTASARAVDEPATFAGGAGCEIYLSVWPVDDFTQASADCSVGSNEAPNNLPTDGIAVGVGMWDGDPLICVPSCSFSASEVSYQEPCPVDLIPPPLGLATGRLNVAGHDIGGFNWTRVGLTAVLLPTSGGQSAGVAAFIPDVVDPGLGTCSQSGDLTVHIIGAAIGDNGL